MPRSCCSPTSSPATCRTIRISSATCWPISPTAWRRNSPPTSPAHRLRREIIARVVANDLINRGGPSFVDAAAGRDRPRRARGRARLRRRARRLRPAGALSRDRRARQQDRRPGAARSLRRRRPAGARRQRLGPEERQRHRAARRSRSPRCRRRARRSSRSSPRCCRPSRRERHRGAQAWPGQGRRAGEARRPAGAARRRRSSIPDIALVAQERRRPISSPRPRPFSPSPMPSASAASRMRRGSIAPSDYYEGMALSRAGDTIGAARRGMAVAALTGFGKAGDPVAAWLEAGGERIAQGARAAAGADRRRRHHRVAAVGGVGADERPGRPMNDSVGTTGRRGR